MKKGHRIEKFEDVQAFLERMRGFDEAAVECTPHTFFRLSQKQRRVFTCEELKRFLLCEQPLKVGIQRNGNFAVYYKYKEKSAVLKVVIGFKLPFASIITFYVLDASDLPRG